VTSPELPDYAPIPRSALGPALNDQGYYVGRVERNLYWVTDGVYQSAFLTTDDGVVLFDAPPTIGGNRRRAVDEIAAANGVTNRVTHLVYSQMAAPATALDYPWTHFICGHLGRLATREDVAVHQAYIADIEASSKEALASVDPVPFLMHYAENVWAGGAAGSSRSSGSCRGRTCTTPWPARSPPCADAGAWPVAVIPHSRLSRGLAPAGHRAANCSRPPEAAPGRCALRPRWPTTSTGGKQ
jgi:hypothetical protein